MIRRWFRRTRPAPQHRLDPHEVMVYRAWNLTEAQWRALPAQERANKRTLYTKAPGYRA